MFSTVVYCVVGSQVLCMCMYTYIHLYFACNRCIVLIIIIIIINGVECLTAAAIAPVLKERKAAPTAIQEEKVSV